ncbi:MAG: hypothetical protein ACOH1R_01545 [Luteimonas sp.]
MTPTTQFPGQTPHTLACDTLVSAAHAQKVACIAQKPCPFSHAGDVKGLKLSHWVTKPFFRKVYA